MDPRTPVLAGVGMVEQREEDPASAVEPLELMRRAVRAAGDDAGALALLDRVDLVSMPHGQWHYSDPGREFGKRTIVARVGILQQSLIGDACRRIAEGEIDVALVIGAEGRYRKLRARILGVDAPENDVGGAPDTLLEFNGPLVLRSEVDGGLGGMPVGYYAIIESALRAAEGLSIDAHRDRLAALYSRFSEIAVDNPHAWKREPVAASFIRDASDKNPMLAFPYTKLHNSSWNVDQATALLLTSAEVAEQSGVDRSRWVFPRVSAESNAALALSERPDLADVPGVRMAGQRAYEVAGVGPGDLDLVELYSCFPVAVRTHARELGIGDDVDKTVTGGMPFAGGPFNSYVLQSTGRMAERLRELGTRATGLVTSVSGLLTKHGVALWSTAPGPNPFVSLDVTDDVNATTPARTVVTDAAGAATIVGYTVVYDGESRHGVALVDLDTGARTLVRSDDPSILESMEAEEWVGRRVRVGQGMLLPVTG